MKNPGTSKLKTLWKNICIFSVFLCKIFKLQVSSDFDKSETSNDWGGGGGVLDPSLEFSELLFLFDLEKRRTNNVETCLVSAYRQAGHISSVDSRSHSCDMTLSDY